MNIQYALSFWNFRHYQNLPDLAETMRLVAQQGYGVELWQPLSYGVPIWLPWPEEVDLVTEPEWPRLRALLAGSPLTMHSAGLHSLAAHRAQIEMAAALGARLIVIHGDEVSTGVKTELDAALCREVVAYAAEKNVQIALENGQLPFLMQAIAQVDGLGICLDIGHVYLTEVSMTTFLAELRERIIHLHIQEIWSPAEAAQGLPLTIMDHYTPGSGGIPAADWELLAATLHEINFEGTAVFEIQPRNVFQNAFLARRFLRSLNL